MYSRDQFFRLVQAIEEQGGTHLDKVHEHSNFTVLCGGPVTDAQMGYMKNCGESILFQVPYHNGTETSSLEVCAKDDMLGNWPRFAAARASTGDSE